MRVVTEALKNIELQDRPIVHERAQLAGLEGLEPGRQVGHRRRGAPGGLGGFRNTVKSAGFSSEVAGHGQHEKLSRVVGKETTPLPAASPRGRQFRTQNSEGLRGPLTSRRFLDGLIFSRGDQAVFGD